MPFFPFAAERFRSIASSGACATTQPRSSKPLRPALAEALSERGAEVLVLGRLIWSDAELMWRAEWRLEWQGQSHEWSFAAITFDEAFRRGLGEAAQIVASQP